MVELYVGIKTSYWLPTAFEVEKIPIDLQIFSQQYRSFNYS